MSEKKKIAVFTSGRQDWSVLRGLCELLSKDDAFDFLLFAGGMACDPAFGGLDEKIEALGMKISEKLIWPINGVRTSDQAAEAIRLSSYALRKHKPDAIVLLGDRFETAAVALASTFECIPVVHLDGGDETEGAFDNLLRHSISKLSHLHLVPHKIHAQRLMDMGEDKSTIHVVGALNVDNIVKLKFPTREELERELNINLESPVGLITIHPTTHSLEGNTAETLAVIEAIKTFQMRWVITLPNADPGNEEIRAVLLKFAKENGLTSAH